MATDPRKLRPSELCRLLNSTPLGEVINERQLHRHRSRAGNRIGDGRHVDLLRYVAWLVQQRHAPKTESNIDPYEQIKERARARNAALAVAGRDIGELPDIVDPKRKKTASSDFRYFCDSYFPLTFHLPWSPDHLKVIARIEQAVLRGGLFSMAMPRGSGKTTICECACIWAVLNGHRGFVCLIGSDEGHSMDMLDSIKMEFDGNELLLEDYPEVVYPIQSLDGRLQDEAAFFAEYQNEPLPEETGTENELTAEEIASKFNRMKRRELPIATNHLTMFIDVQGNMLFYLVAAWEDDFTGYVVDYGAYPDQKRPYFTLRDARYTLAMVSGTSGLEGSIYAGLEQLTSDLLNREWRRDDGAMLRIERCLVDANWGSSTDVVYQFCRQSQHAGVILPSHGRFAGASSQPFSDYKRKPGDRVGHNWRLPTVKGKRAVRHVVYDTNYWKSFIHSRLAVPMGDRGCLSLFGTNSEQHRLLAEHLTAEYRVKTEGRGRTVDEWKIRPERSDNHWFDCLVGSAVAASMQGCVLDGTDGTSSKANRNRVSFAEMQRRRRR